MSHSFCRLAPFIREYIHSDGWTELREIQDLTIHSVFDDNKHILISSGTASGKTEAAFYPILSQLDLDTCSSVAILYISPLKALINDQFQRLERVIEQSRFKITKWHGDVSATHKKRLLDKPHGILQITPESLEAMLIRRPGDVVRLFHDLRYIVIDEIHAFMGTERGGQLLCQISKIENWTGCLPRRIGLSATLGDYMAAAKWLAAGSNIGVEILAETKTKKKMRLAIDWFQSKKTALEEQEDLAAVTYFHTLYQWCSNTKSIIFTNSRGEAENTISQLRQIAKEKGESDIYHVHHGNISKLLRMEAEEAMREAPGPMVTAATLTLELGIDLGKLERVLQIGAPHSCSSFLQRLGRSGRRTGISEMYFSYLERPSDSGDFFEEFPWALLQMVAIIQLYREEQWIEPIRDNAVSFSLLYHQTMSMLASKGELSPADLARNTLNLPSFLDVTQEDYRMLLKHLIEIDHIEQTEENTLILGLKAEPIVNHFTFYSVFPEEEECKVIHEGKELGSINSLPPLQSAIILAGRFWKVIDLDPQKKMVYVNPAKKASGTPWQGGAGELHSKIVKRMKALLLEDETETYPYLTKRAALRFDAVKLHANRTKILGDNILTIEKGSYLFIPWEGKKAMITLEYILRSELLEKTMEVQSVSRMGTMGFRIRSGMNEKEFRENFYDCIRSVHMDDIKMDSNKIPYINKYDYLLPKELLVKQYKKNNLDFSFIDTLL